jgi:hypothetical protein
MALLLILALLCQLLTGCVANSTSPLSADTPAVFGEDFIYEETIAEENLDESFIIENLIYEDNLYEYQISEGIISEAYVLEITVGELTPEEIAAQLPAEFDEYDIDWPKVIGKFAIGTVIIIAVGLVNHITKGSTFFVFGSPVTVARDALVGGAIGATLNELVGCLQNEDMPQKGVTKYAVEGFADGYMWGAIASVTKISAENFKRLKAFKLAAGGTASIKPDGRVFNEAGKLIGKAFYEKSGLWYLLDDASNAIQVFDKAGKAITDPAMLSALKTLPSNTMLRLGTAADAAICCTDDIGQIIRVGNDLLPNICYQINGYTYYTDDLGRISKVAFEELRMRPEGQLRLEILDSKNAIGKGFEKLADDRGHLIGDLFDGNNTLANIVPMDGTVNKSDVRVVEIAWQKCLENGGSVHGRIEITYSGESFRPDSFIYIYDMGDGVVSTIISNIL